MIWTVIVLPALVGIFSAVWWLYIKKTALYVFDFLLSSISVEYCPWASGPTHIVLSAYLILINYIYNWNFKEYFLQAKMACMIWTVLCVKINVCWLSQK